MGLCPTFSVPTSNSIGTSLTASSKKYVIKIAPWLAISGLVDYDYIAVVKHWQLLLKMDCEIIFYSCFLIISAFHFSYPVYIAYIYLPNISMFSLYRSFYPLSILSIFPIHTNRSNRSNNYPFKTLW